MGGDMRVQGKPPGGLGALDKLEVIDAESADLGDFTAKRTVDGKDVFLTEAGAAEFDRLVADEFEMKVVETPHGIGKLLWETDVLGPKGLLFPGDPKAKR